ncbi:MAG TPA: glycoside hydrolase family 3 N-terminal domain-containing protein [Acidimicrobiales bacterium]|nr:glycoside hydrolase family 3 N-terminal domain-containing protein [Acidimicrobiales bacterium]
MTSEAYRDPTRSLDERADDLLARMTLDEKLAQLSCAWISSLMDRDGFSADRAREVAPHGIGEVTRISGATALLPHETAELANELQRYMVEGTRLGIPALVHEEGTGGFLARGATTFPQSLGLASSWNPVLVEQVAAVVREQMAAVGARHCLAPVLDVARDPRFGRVEETFGEDPHLVGVLGVAYTRGLQTGDLAGGVLATGKHFVAYALPEGGRNHAPVQLGPRELRDVYAEPFSAVIAGAGIASVMSSYSSVDGLACAGSRAVLSELLREELGFDGLVVADYFGVALLASHHRVAAGNEEAAVRALSAGLDLELPETDCFGAPLRAAIESGAVAPGQVDAAARRMLIAKLGLGLFESPFVDAGRAPEVFDTDRQRLLARRAAAESLVLLRNNGVLPLTPAARCIAVLGPGADDARLLQGDYHYPSHHGIADEPAGAGGAAGGGGDAGDGAGGGARAAGGAVAGDGAAPAGTELDAATLQFLPRSGGEWQPGRYYTAHVTPLEGIRSLAGAGVVVTSAPGCAVTGGDASGISAAAALAAQADVAIVVVAGRSGLSPESTVGEARDATSLELTGQQLPLVRAVAGTGTPTVVVVLSGRVHSLVEVDACCAALVQAWPLGEEGGNALAEVLFGMRDPSGRLPVSLPRTVGQVPLYSSHRAGGATSMFYGAYTDSPVSPLFPFGHGLSYARFEYGELSIAASDTASPVTVACEVTNTSARAGDEVVQLYVSDLVASVARPDRQLVAFAKVRLEPGETRRITFRVEAGSLAFTGEDLRRVVEPGELRFAAGSSSADLRASGTVRLAGETVEHPFTARRPGAVTVGEPSASRR